MDGPLAGCRVIELAHIMAGPVTGLMLADMGADVIKVEKSTGDDTRRMVPPTIKDESAAYMMMNRNKRGIVLNLKSAAGKKAFLALIRGADVLIENFRLGAMEKLGLGYEQLREQNPGLIYLALSGFGRTGPYAERGGFDLVAQGMSGLMSITGEGQDRQPVKCGAPVSDITAGILGAMGVAAAYAYKLKTGQGQLVDTSLFEAGITQTYWQSAIAMATGESPGAMGSAHPLNAPYQSMPTQDGWINIGAANQANWQRLTEVLQRPDLLIDHRFASNAERMANRQQLIEQLSITLVSKTSAEWLELLEKSGLPAGPILSISEMHNDPQTKARDMVIDCEHPVCGAMQSLGSPVKFSCGKHPSRPAPTLGQHTEEVLSEVGLDQQDIEQIKQQAG